MVVKSVGSGMCLMGCFMSVCRNQGKQCSGRIVLENSVIHDCEVRCNFFFLFLMGKNERKIDHQRW